MKVKIILGTTIGQLILKSLDLQGEEEVGPIHETKRKRRAHFFISPVRKTTIPTFVVFRTPIPLYE
ncbi:hypothetical protein EP1X_06720 [Thermococcus sp. EP1]|uniref:hypothetical protein n=1 Tax=Thermococcus sp. EP1 TaxID=1591054 RepID=UPI0006D9EB1E|nr:hypothetical protein [Thermococcus sp. EP1]KPU62747.1 hypothetical protein EP1X_06720 [Thermococcus sp. EP1]